MNENFRINTPKVISEPMDHEQVVINLENGCYYNLNESGALIFRLIEAGYATEEIISLIAKAFEENREKIAGEVSGFLTALLTEQLITASELAQARAEIAMPIGIAAFTAPGFEKYADMQDMLLLDPIHEVTEAGWPHTPEG
jgi:hypothetical protein